MRKLELGTRKGKKRGARNSERGREEIEMHTEPESANDLNSLPSVERIVKH